MNLKPLGNRVILKPLKQEEKTASGIILPDTVEKEKSEKGEVIAVGPGKVLDNGERLSMSVEVGNKVLFKKYSEENVKIDNEEYLVVDENDILAIIE